MRNIIIGAAVGIVGMLAVCASASGQTREPGFYLGDQHCNPVCDRGLDGPGVRKVVDCRLADCSVRARVAAAGELERVRQNALRAEERRGMLKNAGYFALLTAGTVTGGAALGAGGPLFGAYGAVLGSMTAMEVICDREGGCGEQRAPILGQALAAVQDAPPADAQEPEARRRGVNRNALWFIAAVGAGAGNAYRCHYHDEAKLWGDGCASDGAPGVALDVFNGASGVALTRLVGRLLFD